MGKNKKLVHIHSKMDNTIINNLVPEVISSHFFKLGFVFLDINEHPSYWKKGDEHKWVLLIEVQQNIIQAYWLERYYFPDILWNLGPGYCFPRLSDTKSEGRLYFFLFACLLSNPMVTTALPDSLFVLRQEERSNTFLFLSVFHLLGLEGCLTLLRSRDATFPLNKLCSVIKDQGGSWGG